MSDIEKHANTELAITADQQGFTQSQRTALSHMGVEEATDDDLKVFFHQVKRTGLDPFSRQIHMIGRGAYNVKTKQYETKYTIQTGIDGYRLIGRRAADQTQDTISIGAPEWLHEDGSWRPAWSKKWGYPLAARVTLHRAGQPFTAVAMFDEYMQSKKNGDLTSMWQQRPAGQLSKCAEALAWRMAFPQDLAGIYTTEEMAQADNPEPQPAPTTQEGHDKGDPLDPEQAIRDAWNSLDALQRLGTWASKNGWSDGHVQMIRDRWTELNNQTQPQPEQSEPTEGEIIDEPQG